RIAPTNYTETAGPGQWKVKGQNMTLGEWIKTDSNSLSPEGESLAQVSAEAADVVEAAVGSAEPPVL
ncbi:hypothetical protein, partial [Corynebacterium sp. HMSC11D10]|uniref:hypothetical protein n=1 Tax=Corynebacterium sp. HMSC11D10 TaxID=1581088 RepID=UPI001AEFEABF